MSHDKDIILDLVQEQNIEIQEKGVEELTVGLWIDGFATIDVQSDFSIVVDLDSMGSEIPDPFYRYGRVHRFILFSKSVIGKKETFGQSSFAIINNIQTIGTADINPANHNLVGRQFVFGKAVSAKKTTFGRLSLGITSNIQTAAVNAIGDLNFYGSGLYGAGIYGDAIGYGSGAYGFGIYPGDAVRLALRFGSIISAVIPFKQTSVGEVSLAAHGDPYANIDHAIVIRARTTSGSSGVIRAALYEGATNRSGDLETPPLTNTLTNYELSIPVEAASAITDYSNLSIRFWGYDLGGNSLVFEIARLYLKLPMETGGIFYGAVSRPITFTKAVSGVVNNKKTSIAEISLGSHGLPSERTNHSIKLRARTTTGSTGVIKVALYEGGVNRTGDLITTPLSNVLTDYKLIILDYLAATINDYSNLSIRFWGYDIAGNALVFEVSRIYLELPTSTGNVTHYGAISRAITFTKAVSGVITGDITHYGAISRAITFTKAVSGVITSKRTTTAEISLASHGTPSTRINHSIKVRARTTSGSTGVLKAELYEGSTVRSGATPLATTPLTNSLVDYSLAIPEASAATITSYSNLSIKFWGFDSSGNALVFEVSRIYLELPST